MDSRRVIRKRRGRLFVAFERVVLGAGMGVVAFFIERRLIKAIKKGSVEPAPRTAEQGKEPEPSQGLLSTGAHGIRHRAER